MSKAILYIIIGALVASGVWGYAYHRADRAATDALEQVRAERDEAFGRARSLESELDESLSRIRGLEDAIGNLKKVIDDISVSSESLDSGVGEYGRINRDFREFLKRYGAEK